MQLVSQVLSTFIPAMTIVNAEKAAIWPVLNVFFIFRAHYVEDNAHPVFVVMADQPGMRVGRVTVNTVVLVLAVLSWVDMRYLVNGNSGLGSYLQRGDFFDFLLLEIIGFGVI